MASITVKLFAAYQEAYGKPEVVLEVDSGLTVAEVGDRIRTPFPALASACYCHALRHQPWVCRTRYHCQGW